LGLAKPPKNAYVPDAQTVYAGGSATFDETTGKRLLGASGSAPVSGVPVASGGVAPKTGAIPPKNVFIPANGGKGTQYEVGMADLVDKKKKGDVSPSPTVYAGGSASFNETTGKRVAGGVVRPQVGAGAMPPKTPPVSGGGKKPAEVVRYVIGGKRYTTVGNMLVPDEVSPGGKVKNFYMK
jgi:hypothetical protein